MILYISNPKPILAQRVAKNWQHQINDKFWYKKITENGKSPFLMLMVGLCNTAGAEAHACWHTAAVKAS